MVDNQRWGSIIQTSNYVDPQNQRWDPHKDDEETAKGNQPMTRGAHMGGCPTPSSRKIVHILNNVAPDLSGCKSCPHDRPVDLDRAIFHVSKKWASYFRRAPLLNCILPFLRVLNLIFPRLFPSFIYVHTIHGLNCPHCVYNYLHYY